MQPSADDLFLVVLLPRLQCPPLFPALPRLLATAARSSALSFDVHTRCSPHCVVAWRLSVGLRPALACNREGVVAQLKNPIAVPCTGFTECTFGRFHEHNIGNVTCIMWSVPSQPPR